MITLYIKTHNVTGLKYFGKTTLPDAHKYKGSGKVWARHIKKHGYDVTTEIIGAFDDVETCTEFATKFSIDNNIVESSEWANLIVENGLDGRPNGCVVSKHSDECKQRLSNVSKQRWADPEFKEKMRQTHIDRWNEGDLRERQSNRLKSEFWTDERKANHSTLMKEKLQNDPILKEKISSAFKTLERTDEHNANIAKALRGKPKTKEHIDKMKVKKSTVCRISDRKEMAVGHYTRWLTKLLALSTNY